MIRIFFLLDVEDGGMRKFIDEDDFIIYCSNQLLADLTLEGLREYADMIEGVYDARIDHPVLITIFNSSEAYSYTKFGNIDVVYSSGGEALSHSVLRSTGGIELAEQDTELNRMKAKHNDTMEHEFTHCVNGYMAEIEIPTWVNEGSAMHFPECRVYGYIGFNIQYFEQHHNYWNNKGMLFPDLDNAFTVGYEDPGYSYHMSYSAFTFLRDHVSKETLFQFMKRPGDFSMTPYSGVDEFQRHLYETMYHQYMPSFLFNPNWDLERAYTPGTTAVFSWDGHYIQDLIIEYSVDRTKTWSQIAEVTLSSGSYSWDIPNAENSILRFSDKRFPEINFSYQILGDKPALDKVLLLTFENGAENSIPDGNNGRIKGDVSFLPRGGENGSYAKFDGRWDAIDVFSYSKLSLDEEWTIQADFLIENTTGLTNKKPVLLEKMATLQDNINYAISFNQNGQNHLLFEYQLEDNTTVSIEIDNAGITNGNWYTFYFARSVENNIAEARVYDQSGTLLGSKSIQISGEGKLLCGAGDLYLSSGDFRTYEQDLQGGLDNIIISDTYYDDLMSIEIDETEVLTVTPSNQDVGAEAGTTTFDISSNTSWTVSDDADWLTLSSESGSNNNTLTATYTANIVVASRTATITITDSGMDSKTVTVIQSGVDGMLTTSSENFIFHYTNAELLTKT